MSSPLTDPVVVLGCGPNPTQHWAELLIAGPIDHAAWLSSSGSGGEPRVEDDAAGVVVSGRPADLARLAQSLAPTSGATELGRAARSLLRPPPPLHLGPARWRFGARTYLLGVVNVTPDSFSGDGVGRSPEAALERALQLVAEGADAIDVGGESSRPGHLPVPLEEELRRVVPAVERIAAAAAVPVFVDTAKAAVASAALAAGAVAVNDIWGLRGDPAMAEVVAAARAAVVCMHNQVGTAYADLLIEVSRGLQRSLELARQAGIPPALVLLDPGIGFGKTPLQNLEVLRRLGLFRLLGRPLLVGTSRKSTVGWLLDNRPVEGRLLGTAATVAHAVAQGADVVRVHDVAEMRDVTRVMDRLTRPGRRSE